MALPSPWAIFLALQFLFLGICHATDRPIIGVLTEPCFPEHIKYGQSYIPLDYVQWIESAGARVVPIKFDLPLAQIETLFNSVNGLLFIGGDAAINKSTVYEKAASYLVQLAVQGYYNKGDYFPIWGTCLGLELLSIIISDDNNILDTFDSENISIPLNFTSSAASSRLFQGLGSDVAMKILSSRNMTMNWHSYGVTPSAWQANTKLFNFFKVLSTNLDKQGKEFISLFEGREVPVYASQWHPERNQFDWSEPGEPLDHSLEAIQATQFLANAFVQEARQNNHRFLDDVEEMRHLIYRYTATYTIPTDDHFYTKMYFFD